MKYTDDMLHEVACCICTIYLIFDSCHFLYPTASNQRLINLFKKIKYFINYELYRFLQQKITSNIEKEFF